VKDILFAVLFYGVCPALLCGIGGLATVRAKGGGRQVSRVLSLLAALYFSFAAVFMVVVVATASGPGDGAGLIFVFVFVGLSALGAFLSWALVLHSFKRDE